MATAESLATTETINGKRYYNIHFTGTTEFNNAKNFLESISDWVTVYVNNVSLNVIKQIQTRLHEIEKYFYIYLIIENDNLIIFGDNTNVDKCVEYITDGNNVDNLDILPPFDTKQIRLKIKEIDLQIGVRLENLAIVFPTFHGIDNTPIVTDNIKILHQIFQKYNLEPFILEIHQKDISTLERIPMDIVKEENDGHVYLKQNIIGIFSIASRIVPSKYKKILFIEPGCILQLADDLEKRFISILSGWTPVIKMGQMILFNQRDILMTIPPYFFGANTSLLDQILKQPIPIDKDIDTNQFGIIHTTKNEPLEKDLIINILPNSVFFTIIMERSDEPNMKYIEVDFTIGALPLVLSREKLLTQKPGSIEWISNYISKYLGDNLVKIMNQNIEIIQPVDIDFVNRLTLAIENVLVSNYGIQLSINIVQNEEKIIVNLLPDVEKKLVVYLK